MDKHNDPKIVASYDEITSSEQYYNSFSDIKEALKSVLDIRKFEIELYWKRATYNWAFVAAIIVGYFAISSSLAANKDSVDLLKLQYLLNCLGLVFSIAWYFVNRGSKYWQNNWERHLDLLEDKVYGPLYKMNAKKSFFRKRFFHLLGAFPFSPTKINHLLGLFMIFVWLALIVEFAVKHYRSTYNQDTIFFLLVSVVSVVAIASMIMWGKTGKKRIDDNYTFVDFEKRGIKNK